ncbi:hypothetical protein ACGF1Z_18345 [Streptomyces sp. NPDC048018]|uniref:hypothetical protein n=1 Tax=Streptomyces sp. NPDC048018 TaxID=3365499 RepID=UPI00372277F4
MLRHARRARRTALSRTALATATVLAATTGLSLATTGPALAEDPAPSSVGDEVVIPDPGRYKPRTDAVHSAGATGFLHSPEGAGKPVWTDYATGTETPRDTVPNGGHSGLGASLHTFSTGRKVLITDIATGTGTYVPVPADQEWTQAYNADTVLTSTKASDGKITGLYLRTAANGTVTERPVTGLGEATTLVVAAQDARGAVLSTKATPTAPYTSFLLDYESATLTPTLQVSSYAAARLGADRLLVTKSDLEVLTVRRNDAAATPETTPLPPAAPYETRWGSHAVIGDWVITHHDVSSLSPEHVGGKLYAVPVGGGAARELLPAAVGRPTVAADGSVLVVGGSGATDWAVHRITLGEDGAPRLTKLRDLPRMPANYAGLDIAGGRVNFLADSGPRTGLYEADTSAPGEVRRLAEPYAPDGLRALGDGQSVYFYGSSAVSPSGSRTSRQVNFPATDRLADAAGRFVIAESGDQQYVGDLGERPGEERVLLTRSRTAAALWGTKLWKPAAATGKVNAYDLVGKWTEADVDLGSGCVPTELQVLDRWIYWACGPDGKAGVHDRWQHRNVAVPAGEALLGDGYVVRRDNAAGKLMLTDAATGTTSEFADVPVVTGNAGRRTDWAVDKYGGGVGFVDAQRNIHVKHVPIAPAGPALTHASADERFDVASAQDPAWDGLFRLSRPVAQWKVEIRDRSRRLVRTLTGTGGPAATVTARWDGRDDAGRGVFADTYGYELLVAPEAGDGFVLETSGSVEARNTVLTTLPGGFLPLQPHRVLDTRSGVGAPKAKVGPWQRVSLKVAGAGGVPATGATSVVLNVTVTGPTKPGHINVAPASATWTPSSHLNFGAGETTSNLVVMPVVDGRVELLADTGGTVDLVADVAGYYTPGAAGSAYQPLAPARFMDTRSGTGVPKAKIGPGATARLRVAGVQGVPESGVTAVVMNVTATNASSSTFVTAYPDGTPLPGTSNLNVPAGRTVAGLVVVPVVNGRVAFTNRFGSLDLVGDVVGYYTSGTGHAFTGSESRRLMDTRSGLGVRKGAVGAGQSVTLPVAGVGAVPAGVKAVVLNVTATQPTVAGFVSVYPSGTPRTTASSLNFRAGQTVPNQVVVPVVDGKVTFYNHSGSVQLIADVEGWFR